ncbi:MAG: OadG family protein [Clostridia bacterium]|nr:OadG family protein [Clostridia bacterium]
MFDFNIGFENFTKDPNVDILFICAMGIATVFVGLICLVVVCKLLSWLVKGKSKTLSQPAQVATSTPASAPVTEQPIENKQELLAAISAAVAEELGTDVSGIRITSFKKL